MHSDQVNPDSNENPEIRDNENQANQLIDQFFSDEGVTIPADFRSGFVAIVGVQM
jgi:GTP-binding protein Era